MESPLTTAGIARRFGVKTWQARRIFQRGMLPEPARAGLVRVVAESDLPAVEDALRRAGYLKDEAVSVA